MENECPPWVSYGTKSQKSTKKQLLQLFMAYCAQSYQNNGGIVLQLAFQLTYQTHAIV